MTKRMAECNECGGRVDVLEATLENGGVGATMSLQAKAEQDRARGECTASRRGGYRLSQREGGGGDGERRGSSTAQRCAGRLGGRALGVRLVVQLRRDLGEEQREEQVAGRCEGPSTGPLSWVAQGQPSH